MSVCSMNEIQFINPLPWPHGIVKCLVDVHLRISWEIVGHPGTFRLLFDEYCEQAFVGKFGRRG